jgi:hypothetical protein
VNLSRPDVEPDPRGEWGGRFLDKSIAAESRENIGSAINGIGVEEM